MLSLKLKSLQAVLNSSINDSFFILLGSLLKILAPKNAKVFLPASDVTFELSSFPQVPYYENITTTITYSCTVFCFYLYFLVAFASNKNIPCLLRDSDRDYL